MQSTSCPQGRTKRQEVEGAKGKGKLNLNTKDFEEGE